MSFKRNTDFEETNLIDSCIKNFFNKRLTDKLVTLTAEKKNSVLVLSILGKLSLDLRTYLKEYK